MKLALTCVALSVLSTATWAADSAQMRIRLTLVDRCSVSTSAGGTETSTVTQCSPAVGRQIRMPASTTAQQVEQAASSLPSPTETSARDRIVLVVF